MKGLTAAWRFNEDQIAFRKTDFTLDSAGLRPKLDLPPRIVPNVLRISGGALRSQQNSSPMPVRWIRLLGRYRQLNYGTLLQAPNILQVGGIPGRVNETNLYTTSLHIPPK